MTFDNRTRKKILFCSFTLFLIALTYRIMNPFTQPTVKELTYRGGQSATPPAGKGKEEQSLRLFTELFFTVVHPPSGVINNLFEDTSSSSSEELTSNPTPEEASEYQASINKELESDDSIQGEEKGSPLTGIVGELLHLRILGACRKDKTLSIFIKDENSVVVVEKGDKIKGLYPVTELTQEYILIRIPAFHEDVRINLKDFNENRYL